MQDILGRNRLAADAGFGKGHIFGDGFVEVMADHEHIQMLVHRVYRKRPGRVGRCGQYVRFAANLNDIRGMAAPCPFGMERMNGATLDRAHGVFNKAGLVQRVGMDHYLHIHRIGDAQAAVNRGGGRAPILVQLQTGRTGQNLLLKPGGQGRVALARKGEVHRKCIGGLQHPRQMPGAGGAGGGQRAMRRAGAAADHRGQAGIQGVVNLLRANEMDM